MVNGPSPGQPPACQARQQLPAHPVQLANVAPTEAAQEGSQGGWRLDLPPRVRAVPPVRNASASSMQSPPASAEATKVITLSPVGPARGVTQIQALLHQLGKAEVVG